MSFTSRFILFQSVIIIPFLIGYIIKERIGKPESVMKGLIKINLTGIEPLVAFWSIWGLALKKEIFVLPLSGLLLVFTGFLAGRFVKPLLLPELKSRTSFYISAALANHGFTMGGFLCFLFLGEKGLALSFLFLMYFVPFIFIVVFPYARRISTGEKYNWKFVKNFLLSLQNFPLYAVMVSLILNTSGFKRPDIYFPVEILIMLSIGLNYLTLGLNFFFSDLTAYNRENLLLSLIKFLMVPLAVFIVLRQINLDADIESVIMIQAFMPAAVYSVMTSVLYDLDARQSSSLFIINTIIFLLAVLPLLFYLRGYLFRAIS